MCTQIEPRKPHVSPPSSSFHVKGVITHSIHPCDPPMEAVSESTSPIAPPAAAQSQRLSLPVRMPSPRPHTHTLHHHNTSSPTPMRGSVSHGPTSPRASYPRRTSVVSTSKASPAHRMSSPHVVSRKGKTGQTSAEQVCEYVCVCMCVCVLI
jgi:hypothetical protein